jgi:hypothetical protein
LPMPHLSEKRGEKNSCPEPVGQSKHTFMLSMTLKFVKKEIWPNLS